VRDLDESAREDWLARLADDWRRAELTAVDAALCTYAEKLTRAPAHMREADLAPLRAAGLDDVAIHAAIQVIAYFNYINRVADAVHVSLERGMPPYPEPRP
jgi:uncharacterized peroxidase-related enzyme